MPDIADALRAVSLADVLVPHHLPTVISSDVGLELETAHLGEAKSAMINKDNVGVASEVEVVEVKGLVVDALPLPPPATRNGSPVIVLDCTYGWPSEKVPRRERINGVASQLFNHLSGFASRSSVLHVIGRDFDLAPLRVRLDSLLPSPPPPSCSSLSFHAFASLSSYLSSLRASDSSLSSVPCHYLSPDAPARLPVSGVSSSAPLLTVVGGLIDRKTVVGRSLSHASSCDTSSSVYPVCLPLEGLSIEGLEDCEPLNVDCILDLLELWHASTRAAPEGGEKGEDDDDGPFRRAAFIAMERHKLRHPKRTLHSN